MKLVVMGSETLVNRTLVNPTVSSGGLTVTTGKIGVGTTAAANINMTTGITINQGAADDEALCLKSTDVAHGMTNSTDTDTYGVFMKHSGDLGGLRVMGFSESASGGLVFYGTSTTDTTAKNDTARGTIRIIGNKKSATTIAAQGAEANVLSVENGVFTRFILDADGDSHQDVGTAWTNFDTEDDLALLNTLADEVSKPDDPIKDDFRRFLTYNRSALERARLVSFNDDGHHFVNMSRLTMLLVGAARQLGLEVASLKDEVAGIKALVAGA